MKSLTLLVSTLIIFSFASFAHADTCTMLDGREINGRLVRESKSYVYFDVAGVGIIRLNKDRIVALIEDSNFGKGFVTAPAETPKTDEKTDESAEKKPEAKPTTDTKFSEEEQKLLAKLPKANGALSADRQVELLKALVKFDSPENNLLPATEASAEERSQITLLFKQSGYVRKVGNRNQREVAVTKLAKFQLKLLPSLLQPLTSDNPYQRRNAARVLSIIATNNPEWHWYAEHFKLTDQLVKLVSEQSTIYSFAVRASANEALSKIYGQDFGFKDNTDQLRTPSQVQAQVQWQKFLVDFQKQFKAQETQRQATYDKLLDAWKNGMKSKETVADLVKSSTSTK